MDGVINLKCVRRVQFVLMIASVFFVSCKLHPGEHKPTLLSNFIHISDNEDKGVKEVLSFYGGECEYSIGASASTKDGANKFFELKVSKSDLIEQKIKLAEMPASNIAYLFFKNLKNERANYNKIHVVLVFKDKSEMNFEYATDSLDIIERKMKLANKAISFIKDKKFIELQSILVDSVYMIYDKNEVLTSLNNIEPKFGTIKSFLPMGFKFQKSPKGLQVIHISGAILRDKQNNEFSIDINAAPNDSSIYLFQYKY